MKVRFTETALTEVSEISTYIANQNSAAAERLLTRLEETIERLRRFPLSARATDDPAVRVAPIPRVPYLVFYTVENDEILIRNVRHAARERQ